MKAGEGNPQARKEGKCLLGLECSSSPAGIPGIWGLEFSGKATAFISSALVNTLLPMALLYEPAAIALEPRDRLEVTLFGEGREPYIMPKVIGMAMGKLSTIEPPTAIVPSPSIGISKAAVLAGC